MMICSKKKKNYLLDGKYYENPILMNFNQIINYLFRNTNEKKEIKKLIILKGLT